MDQAKASLIDDRLIMVKASESEPCSLPFIGLMMASFMSHNNRIQRETREREMMRWEREERREHNFMAEENTVVKG